MPIQLCITIPDSMVPEAKQFVSTLSEATAGTPVLDPNTATNAQIKARGQDILLRLFKSIWRNWRQAQPDASLDTIVGG